ncbi:MAG TPA: hypothetical protein VNU21_13030 [Usitatibacter sp.]|jgi:hypothetical protein|nr:hypothetical protein [Usitatibacter sp.]
MLIHGSCHCGNVSFDLTWDPDPVEIPARACGCSFCTKHGGVWTSNPRGSLTVRMGNARATTAYAFGTHTARFHICTRCGVPVVVTSEIAGRTYAVVNVNSFDNVDPAMLKRTPASFDGEDEGTRLARRQRNWIPDVRIEA